MNSWPARFVGWAAANACSPSFVVGLRLASTRVFVSWSSVWFGDDGRIRWVALLTKLSRVSSVELLIQEVPAGQPATLGGSKSVWPMAAAAGTAAPYPLVSVPVAPRGWGARA